MIDVVPGYDQIPHFQGFRDAPSPQVTILPPATAPAPGTLVLTPPQSSANALIENAVVYGGVPLCGYIFVTKSGPSAWLAALLGLGIGYLYWQSGGQAPPAVALPPQS